MDRIKQFEQMLADVKLDYIEKCEKMEKLRLENKTKTVSYRELMGSKLFYQTLLDLYEKYGLID